MAISKKINFIFIHLILLFTTVHKGNSQCNDYNLCFSTKSAMNYVSDPIPCKNGDYLVAFWPQDSMTLNGVKYCSTLLPRMDHCLLIRFNNQGNILRQVEFNAPYPTNNFSFKLDSSENLYFPISTFQSTYFIKDTLSIPTNMNTIIGLVKISSNFKIFSFIKLGHTLPNKPISSNNLSLECVNNQLYISVQTNQLICLTSNDTVGAPSMSQIILFEYHIDKGFTKPFTVAQSKHALSTIGLQFIQNQLLLISRYTDTLEFPSLKKLQVAINRKLKNTKLAATDYSFAVIQNQNLLKTWNLGCLDVVQFTGKSKLIHSINHRFLLGINNASNCIYDQRDSIKKCINKGMNAILILDTNFNLLKYQALETTNKYGFTYVDFFKNQDPELGMYVGTNKWFSFQNERISVVDSLNKASRIQRIYTFKNDSFFALNSFSSVVYSFRVLKYSDTQFQFILNATNTIHPGQFYSMKLNKAGYSQFSWLGNLCSNVLSNPSIANSDLPQWEVYPNPSNSLSNSVVQFSKNPPINTVIQLFTNSGKLIWQQSVSTVTAEIQLPNLPSGFYFIKSNLNSATLKWIVP